MQGTPQQHTVTTYTDTVNEDMRAALVAAGFSEDVARSKAASKTQARRLRVTFPTLWAACDSKADYAHRVIKAQDRIRSMMEQATDDGSAYVHEDSAIMEAAANVSKADTETGDRQRLTLEDRLIRAAADAGGVTVKDMREALKTVTDDDVQAFMAQRKAS